MVESEAARKLVDGALESLISVCLNLQESIYDGETFNSPEAMRDFREDVRLTLKDEVNTILARIDQLFTAIDKQTIS